MCLKMLYVKCSGLKIWNLFFLASEQIWLPCCVWGTLQWRHNGWDSVSNQQPHDCLLNHFFLRADQRKHQSSASLAFVWGIHRWPVNSPVTGEFPAQMASNAENVSIWWRHHDLFKCVTWVQQERISVFILLEFTLGGPLCQHWFLPEASFGLRVLSSPASVCLCVRVSVCVSITCLSAR